MWHINGEKFVKGTGTHCDLIESQDRYMEDFRLDLNARTYDANESNQRKREKPNNCIFT